jgi:hypothetical protein
MYPRLAYSLKDKFSQSYNFSSVSDTAKTFVKVNIFGYVGFDVLAAVVMKSFILWDIMSRSPLKINRRFGGSCRLHIQDRRTSMKHAASSVSFLLGLFFDPEEQGIPFLKNILSTDYMVVHARKMRSSLLAM